MGPQSQSRAALAVALAGLAGMAGAPPSVKGMSKDPEFIKLRAATGKLPTLDAKLQAIGVQDGFYDAILSLADNRRAVLAQVLLEEALEDVTAGWHESGEPRTAGVIASVLLAAALRGVPDKTLYTLSVLPAGGTLQQAVDTGMPLSTALDILATVDEGAAATVAAGAVAAADYWSDDYRANLLEKFAQRVKDAIPGLGLPGGPLPWLLGGAGLYLAFKVVRSRATPSPA